MGFAGYKVDGDGGDDKGGERACDDSSKAVSFLVRCLAEFPKKMEGRWSRAELSASLCSTTKDCQNNRGENNCVAY